MSKRRIRRKRRARVKILPLILVGAVIAEVITVIMSVNLKGADKEPPTEEIYITETLQAPQAENTEPVTEQEAKLEHDLNYTYPYNTMSADWGSEVYEDGFRYYEIPQEYKDAGGCFPEIVQVYLWCECKEYGVDYYTVLAIIERESGYHWDKVGDNGNSKGYMQIYEKWHTGVSHEIVRHRVASYAQESTRYCNYNKSGDVAFIRPVFFDEDTPEMDNWVDSCMRAEKTYNYLISEGRTPQEARSVLPNSLKTEVVMTANLREWRHFLSLRACGSTGKPHPQMLEVAVPLLKELRERVPVVFDDLEPMEWETVK